jgi:hypothetical protein
MPMDSSISGSDFQVLLRRSGLELTPAQAATLLEGYALMQPMLERIRPARGREAEPAHVFVAGPRT